MEESIYAKNKSTVRIFHCCNRLDHGLYYDAVQYGTGNGFVYQQDVSGRTQGHVGGVYHLQLLIAGPIARWIFRRVFHPETQTA